MEWIIDLRKGQKSAVYCKLKTKKEKFLMANVHWCLFIFLEIFEIPKSSSVAKYAGLQSYFIC